MIDCIMGLEGLHRMGILHRDIKSANIFITKEGRYKIGDMNVSKMIKHGGVLFT